MALGLVLNLTADEARDLVVEDLTLKVSGCPDSDHLTRLAMASRPDLAAIRFGVARSEAEIGLADRAQADRVRDAGLDPVDPELDLDVNQAQPSPAVERVRINVVQCRFQLRALEHAVRGELWNSQERYDSLIISMRMGWYRLKVARRHAADVQRQYEEGKATVADVLKAREAVIPLELASVSGLALVHRQALAINTAVGLRILPWPPP